VLVLAVVGGGLGVGALLSGGPGADGLPGTLAGTDAGEAIPRPGDRIRVEILNSGGIQGAASEARDFLRGEGFDVVYFGNAAAFEPGPTEVVDRTGRAGVADAISRSLAGSEVRSEPDSTRLVDVTVLIGTDWPLEGASGTGSRSDAFGNAESPQAVGAWWDLRRFFDRTR
jgi:hypothetical protein